MKSMHLVICISNLWYLMGIYKFIGFTERDFKGLLTRETDFALGKRA
jgi:hypothetical protein